MRLFVSREAQLALPGAAAHAARLCGEVAGTVLLEIELAVKHCPELGKARAARARAVVAAAVDGLPSARVLVRRMRDCGRARAQPPQVIGARVPRPPRACARRRRGLARSKRSAC